VFTNHQQLKNDVENEYRKQDEIQQSQAHQSRHQSQMTTSEFTIKFNTSIFLKNFPCMKFSSSFCKRNQHKATENPRTKSDPKTASNVRKQLLELICYKTTCVQQAINSQPTKTNDSTSRSTRKPPFRSRQEKVDCMLAA